MAKHKKTTHTPRKSAPPGGQEVATYEVEVAPGLEQVAYQEIQQALGRQLQRLPAQGTQLEPGVLTFSCRSINGSEIERVLQLHTIFNAYRVLTFPVARPKALLAHAHLSRLVETIQQLQQRFPPGYFSNFGISAAGADSLVFRQIAVQLAGELALPFATNGLDLLLRIRPTPMLLPAPVPTLASPLKSTPAATLVPTPAFAEEAEEERAAEWQVLIRLSPRPLSVRAWRAADMKGALNAAVAHAMVRLTHPQAGDKFLNLACGSGTLLIERLIAAPARRVIGCDIDAAALQYAEQNMRAAGLQDVVELHQWDARTLNLPDGYIDAICADLPFGIAVGAHVTNVTHYPQILREAARVMKPKGICVLMTQEVNLMEELLTQATAWKVLDQIRVDLRGLHPRIFVLQRLTDEARKS